MLTVAWPLRFACLRRCDRGDGRNAVQCVVAMLLAVACSPGSVGAQCADDEASVAQLTQQQYGQAVSCAQIIGGRLEMCDDEQLGGWLCCGTCTQMRQQHQADWAAQRQALAGRVTQLQSSLLGPQGTNARFRTPPLHGRGSGMPLLAIGTAGMQGTKGIDLLVYALEMGYRHIDTAIMYGNHDSVRVAVEKSGLPREELFLTTKIPPDMMGYKKSREAVDQIKKDMPAGYADLCLVHWPYTEPQDSTPEMQVVERAVTWRVMEDAYDSGVCRAIGVSNFLVKHLEEMWQYARVTPSVNQLEFTPFAPLRDLFEYCRKHQVIMQAFGWRRPVALEHPVVSRIAAEYRRPPLEVLTWWFIQSGYVPMYMSRRPERVVDHAEAVAQASLSEAQLAEISNQPLATKDSYPWQYYKGKLWPWGTPVMAECGNTTDMRRAMRARGQFPGMLEI